MIKTFSDFMGDVVVQTLDMPSSLGFIYDVGEDEYDREDLNLCLIRVRKMDMLEDYWSLSKFDDSHEDGEYELFFGKENEMSEFVRRYIRGSKFKEILGDD